MCLLFLATGIFVYLFKQPDSLMSICEISGYNSAIPKTTGLLFHSAG